MAIGRTSIIAISTELGMDLEPEIAEQMGVMPKVGEPVSL